MSSKISALTPAGLLSGSETLPGVQSAANVKMTSGDIAVSALRYALAPSGAYYSHPGIVSTGAITIAANTLYAHPILITRAMTIVRLGFQVTTFATGNGRVGLYRDAGGKPGTKILDSGDISTGTSNGIKSVTGLSGVLTPGMYWLVGVFNATPGIQGIATLALMHGLNSSFGRIYGLQRSFTYGALSSDESAQTYSLATTSMPALFGSDA